MADPDAPARAVAAAVERFGGLDGVVSNAGINRPGRLVDYAVDDWDRLFAVNTRATWLLAKAAHPALKASRGAIVAVASMSGSNAHANLGPYGPSKAAVIMLAKVLAQELGRDGIRVNTVSPGLVHTGMTAAVYADQRVAAERAALVPLGRVADARGHGRRHRVPARARRALRQRPRPGRRRRRHGQLSRPPARALAHHPELSALSTPQRRSDRARGAVTPAMMRRGANAAHASAFVAPVKTPMKGMRARAAA